MKEEEKKPEQQVITRPFPGMKGLSPLIARLFPGMKNLSPLAKAALEGDKATIEKLLSEGASFKELVQYRDKEGNTLLMFAVQNGSLEGVQYLLGISEIKVQINTENKKRRTALHIAAYKGHQDIMGILREAGATTTDKELAKYWDKESGTLLIIAVTHESLEGIQYLLGISEIKAQINTENNGGRTALHVAAYKGRQDIMGVLREAGATTTDKELANYRDKDGNTLLMLAAFYGFLEGIHYLLTIPGVKDQINAENNCGCTALHMAAYNGYKDIIGVLREAGASTTDKGLTQYRDKDGNTLLMFAAQNGSLEGVQYLLTIPEIKAEINVENNNGLTALHTAAYKGYKDIIEILREAGATTTDKELAKYRDKEDNTLLMFATQNGSLAAFQYLLGIPEIKVEINTENDNGLTALYIAACKGYKDIIEILREAGAATIDKELAKYRSKREGKTLLMFAAQYRFLEGVQYLLGIPEMKAQINAEDNGGGTALHEAAYKDCKDIIRVLREAGATTTDKELAKYRDKGGNTLLLNAVLNRSLEGVQYLLGIPEIKAEIDTTENNNGFTALHIATRRGYKDIIEILRKAGATTTDKELARYRDKDGTTLLMFAAQNRSLGGIQYLLDIPEIKAEINTKNKKGHTALHMAVFAYNKEIVGVLREAAASPTDKELAQYRNKEGKTLLMFAVQNRSLEGVQYLLGIPEIKAEINTTENNNGWTALHIAACKGCKNIIEILRKAGATITDKELAKYRNKEGTTLLMFAAQNRSLEGVQYLLGIPEIKAEIDTEDNSGFTALHDAAHKGYQDIIEILRKAGATTTDKELANYRDKDGNTLLMFSATFGFLEGIHYLLDIPEIKAEINAENNGGCTALHMAAYNGYKDIIGVLREAGVATTDKGLAQYRDKRGNSLLMFAAQNGSLEGVQYLLGISEIKAQINTENKTECTALHMAAYKGSKDIIGVLREAGASTTDKKLAQYRDKEGSNTLLMVAVQNGSLEGVQYLLGIPEIKAQINTENSIKCTALHMAAYKGSKDIIEVLREAKATTTDKGLAKYRDKEGTTFLMFAVHEGSLERTQYLLGIPEIKAQINAEDNYGCTALHIAASKGYKDIIGVLREAKASTTDKELAKYRDKEDNTLLMIAIQNDWLKGVQYLLSIPEIKKTIHQGKLGGSAALTLAHFRYCSSKPTGQELVEIIKYLLASGTSLGPSFFSYKNFLAAEDPVHKMLKAADDLRKLAMGETVTRTLSQLLEAGASVQQRDTVGASLLHYAIRFSKNKALIKELLKAGLNVNIQNDKGETPTKWAEEMEGIEVENKNSILCILYFHKMKVELKEKNYQEAAQEIIKIYPLLDKIKDINKKEKIFLKLGKKIKNEIDLISFLGIELVYETLGKISTKPNTFYQQAQHELADQYLIDEIKKKDYLQKAYMHACQAGSYPLAIDLRKKIAGGMAGLVPNFSMGAFGSLDPMNPEDSLTLLRRYKEQEAKIVELEKKNKILMEQLSALKLTENKSEGLTFAYSTLSSNDDTKNSNDSGKEEYDDSKARKRNREPS